MLLQGRLRGCQLPRRQMFTDATQPGTSLQLFSLRKLAPACRLDEFAHLGEQPSALMFSSSLRCDIAVSGVNRCGG